MVDAHRGFLLRLMSGGSDKTGGWSRISLWFSPRQAVALGAWILGPLADAAAGATSYVWGLDGSAIGCSRYRSKRLTV